MRSICVAPRNVTNGPATDAGAGAQSQPAPRRVLGTIDGIVSTAGLVVGVAGANTARGVILTAGVAGVVAGAVSMALGEYVSVSSQRDREIPASAQAGELM